MLVKNLVEMHDGTVEVHSAGVGHGTEFVVRLPIMFEATNPQLPEPVVMGPTTTAARRSSLSMTTLTRPRRLRCC